MRLVCPKCKNDDQLYSLESADLMYPITADSNLPKVHYTGKDYIVVDEGTKYEGRIYCRGHGEGLRHEDLLSDSNLPDPAHRQRRALRRGPTAQGAGSMSDLA